MRLLVFQHSVLDHPGIMRDFMRADGPSWDAIDWHEDPSRPTLDGYDALIVMGGPQQADEEEQHPWLATEKALIREAALRRHLPVLGICLGAQLLADATGGRVTRMAEPEIGLLDVALTEAGIEDPLFAGLPETVKTLQWHLHAIDELPPNGRHLARSPRCEFQAFRVGRAAYGLQFHLEVTAEMVRGTRAFPDYVAALEAGRGAGALERLAVETQKNADTLGRSARGIYDNFVTLVRADPGGPA
jgi:GMP synthase-like glutamine amidotransferase